MKSSAIFPVILLAASCGSEEAVKAPTPEIPLKPAEAKAPTTRYPHLGIKELNGVPDISKVEITLERTTCYGWCPAYTITLNGDGTGQYKGTACVVHQSQETLSFDPQLVRDLLDRFEKLDFFALKHDDNWIVHDAPSDIFTLKVATQARTFRNNSRDGFPDDDEVDKAFHRGLYELSVLIDTAAKIEQWIGTESQREVLFNDRR